MGGMFLLHVFLTGDLSMVVGLNKMPLFWMICILIDAEQLLTLVCILLLIHNVTLLNVNSYLMSLQCMMLAHFTKHAYASPFLFCLFFFDSLKCAWKNREFVIILLPF